MKKAKSRIMDKDVRNRNRLSHTSAPLYFAKSKRPPSPDQDGVGASNRLPGGQQPQPRRQRSLRTRGRSAESLTSLHIVETNQEITVESCGGPQSCSYTISLHGIRNSSLSQITLLMTSPKYVWVQQCGATAGQVCASHLKTEIMDGQSSWTKGIRHLWWVPVLTFQDVTYHFRVSQAGEVSCNTEGGTSAFSDYHLLIPRRCV